jgi:hypothetical protein
MARCPRRARGSSRSLVVLGVLFEDLLCFLRSLLVPLDGKRVFSRLRKETGSGKAVAHPAILHSNDLLSQWSELIDAGKLRERKDEYESMPRLHVELFERHELFRARRVENLDETLLPVYVEQLLVCLLDRGVVRLYKDILDELKSQGALSHAAGAHDDDSCLFHDERRMRWRWERGNRGRLL